MAQKLEELSKEDFYKLKSTGMLWEIFPNAPEFYEGIRRMRCSGCTSTTVGVCKLGDMEPSCLGTKGE
jgi:hypothetical protein